MRDSEFIRANVPMTKEEVRILALERLALQHAHHFLDVGAGTGSISIEAGLRYPHLQVLAIEHNADAVQLIEQNKQKFSVANLTILPATAPLPLKDYRADAIFVGGSNGKLAEIINWSHQLLTSGGRLVLNFILLNTMMEALNLLRCHQFEQIDVCQLQVSHLTKLGSGDYFKPANPTYIISCQKTEITHGKQ